MKNISIFILFLFPLAGISQYYYADIIDATAINAQMNEYIKLKVKSITATGYDAQGVKTPDFNEWMEVNKELRLLKITTRNGRQVSRRYFLFDSLSRIVSMADSSGDIISRTSYSYHQNGTVSSIQTITKDSLQDFSETVRHNYIYNSAGLPEKMWRVVNEKDTTEYRFVTDENNVAEEQLIRRSATTDPVYYYYDDRNRLTDIVRYNKKVKKLLPAQMFEYDDKDRLIQKMTVLSSDHPDYLIWRYAYNEKGLKTKEALFNKQKELTGRIDYTYTFE